MGAAQGRVDEEVEQEQEEQVQEQVKEEVEEEAGEEEEHYTSLEDVERVWDECRTEILDLRHTSGCNVRVKDLHGLLTRFSKLLELTYPREELEAFLRADGKFQFMEVGGVPMWGTQGLWRQLRCHLDLPNLTAMVGFVLFHNQDAFQDEGLRREFVDHNPLYGCPASDGRTILFSSGAPWDLEKDTVGHKMVQPIPLPMGDRCFVEVQIGDNDHAPVFIGLGKDGEDSAMSVLRITTLRRWEAAPAVLHEADRVLRVFLKVESENYSTEKVGTVIRADMLVPHDYMYGSHTLRFYITIRPTKFLIEIDCARNATFLHLRSQGAVTQMELTLPHSLETPVAEQFLKYCLVEGLCVCRQIGTDNSHHRHEAVDNDDAESGSE